MNKRFVEALAEFFIKRRLVDTIDAEAIDAAVEEPFLGHIVQELLSHSLLVFDSECFQQDSDIAKLVEELASHTGGEWTLENLKSRLLREQGQGTVEFDHSGEHIVWEFEQYGDYVSDDFWAKVKGFCGNHLSGTFHRLASMSQEVYVLYLAGSSGNEFEELVKSFQPSSDEIAEFVGAVDNWRDKGLTGWMLIRNALRQHNLSNINAPGKSGQLPLAVAVAKAMAGSSSAKELAYALVDLGADPGLLSKEGKLFWQESMR
jgi:hypothetical protein